MTDNRTQVFDVAMKNARTIEACVPDQGLVASSSPPEVLKPIRRQLGMAYRA
jgi:hypothetical protein